MILAIDGDFLARSRFEAGDIENFNIKIHALLDEYHPDRCLIAWDSRESIRRARAPGYKSGRSKPEGYLEQLAELKASLDPNHQFERSGYEGDDILYSISRQFAGEKLIYTCDKDMLQAVRDDTSVLKAGMRGADDTLITEANIVVLTGLTPTAWLHYQALKGDSTDNVPGLPGIGYKTARAILAACPDFVPLVMAGDGSSAFERCAADARLAKWATLAIQHRDDLEQSLFLVQLKLVDLLPTEDF